MPQTDPDIEPRPLTPDEVVENKVEAAWCACLLILYDTGNNTEALFHLRHCKAHVEGLLDERFDLGDSRCLDLFNEVILQIERAE